MNEEKKYIKYYIKQIEKKYKTYYECDKLIKDYLFTKNVLDAVNTFYEYYHVLNNPNFIRDIINKSFYDSSEIIIDKVNKGLSSIRNNTDNKSFIDQISKYNDYLTIAQKILECKGIYSVYLYINNHFKFDDLFYIDNIESIIQADLTKLEKELNNIKDSIEMPTKEDWRLDIVESLKDY